MPVEDLRESQIKRTQRWVGMHNGGKGKCEKEAFSYATFEKPMEKFIGAMIYHRGKRPFKVTEDLVSAQHPCLECESCGQKILSDDQITMAPEIFKVKSLMRYMKIISDWRNALQASSTAHIRMLEYGYLLNIDYEVWKERQEFHDQQLKRFDDSIAAFHEFCAGVGPCELKPSQIAVANRFGGIALSAIKGETP